jgi:flagellar protein FliO/FliZ
MGSTGNMILMIVLYLALIIGLFLVIIRLIAKRNRLALPGRIVRTLGGTSLGPNKSVQVVEIGGAFYILGVGENIGLIAKIDNPEEIEAIRLTMQGPQPGASSFSTLAQWWEKRKGRGPSEQEWSESDFGEIFQERMMAVKDSRRSVSELLEQEESREERKDTVHE